MNLEGTGLEHTTYTISPNSSGDVTLWRIDNGRYDFPIELVSRRELDAIDPAFWGVLVAEFVGSIVV